MKTAIYISDDIFNLAEKIASRLKISRSEFYSRAIKEYIEDFYGADITQKLNSVYEDHDNDSRIDKEIYKAQLNILENEEW
jgi:metal-responsive CopG/Arc/MetJ family transcriptional regulator